MGAQRLLPQPSTRSLLEACVGARVNAGLRVVQCFVIALWLRTAQRMSQRRGLASGRTVARIARTLPPQAPAATTEHGL